MSLLSFISQGLVNRRTLPAAEQALQREHVLDTVVAGLSGINTPEAADLRRVFSTDSVADQAGLYSATTRLSELDDIHLLSCITPSSVPVPVALALIAHVPDLSADRFAPAVAAGTDLMLRFGVAIDGAHALYRGIWPTYLVAPMGAAATASVLFDLDEEAMAHALALALSTSSGTIGRPPEARTGRWFLFASAVASGVRAAQAAQLGILGDLSLLDGDWLERWRGVKFDPAPLKAPPSDQLYATLSQKPYCTGKQCLAAGQAFRALIEEGLDPATVTAIRVRVPPIYAGMVSVKPDKHSRSASLVGAPLQMALAALKPEGRSLVDRSAIQSDEVLARYAERVSIVPDESLQSAFPAQWPAIVEADGPRGTVTKAVFAAYGDPADRMTEAALRDKAHATLDAALGRVAVTQWLSKAKAFDNATGCRALAEEFGAAMRAMPATNSRAIIRSKAV